jgi:corrinoid protein of di/trimethylamine methyltransferase
MSNEKLLNEISDAIINLDKEKALILASRAIDENIDLLEVVEKGFGEGIRKIGDLWDEGEIFLPELMLGGNIMQEAMKILMPHFKEQSQKISLGTVVIATIEGDIHSIGKTIVATMLSANGFNVHDLGADVPAEKIVDEALKSDANFIGISALLTTTMTGQKKVIDILNEKKIRDKFKVILGGAPVSKSWVEECGADGYADNAVSAVEIFKNYSNK